MEKGQKNTSRSKSPIKIALRDHFQSPATQTKDDQALFRQRDCPFLSSNRFPHLLLNTLRKLHPHNINIYHQAFSSATIRVSGTQTHLGFEALKKIREQPSCYFIILIYLSYIRNFEDDFKFFRTISLIDFLPMKFLTSSARAVNNEEFYPRLLEAVFFAGELKVFEAVKSKTSDWRIILNKKILKVFLAKQKYAELESWITGSQATHSIKNVLRSHRFQLSLQDRAVQERIACLLDQLAKAEQGELTKRLFGYFRINEIDFFKKILARLKQRTAIFYVRTFELKSIDREEIQTAFEQEKFNFLLLFPPEQISWAFNDGYLRNKTMRLLRQPSNFKELLLLIYHCKLQLSSDQFVKELGKVLSEIFELNFSVSPIFLCTNPIKACFLVFLLLTFFNDRLKLKNEDNVKVSAGYLNQCEILLRRLPTENLQALATQPDRLNKVFLDYIFKIYNNEVVGTPFVKKEIHSLWEKEQASKTVFSFFYNIHILTKLSMLRKNRLWQNLNFFVPAKTSFSLKYSVYKNSLQQKITTQIINSAFLCGLEIALNYRINSLVLSSGPTSESLFTLLGKESLALTIVTFIVRFSHCLHMVVGFLLAEDFSKVRRLYYVNQAILLFAILNTVLFPVFSIETYKNNMFVLTNFRAVLSYLLIAKVLIFLLPIPKIGFGAMVVLRLVKQTVIYTVFSSVIFIAIAFILYRFFIDFQSTVNILGDMYQSILRLYEYSFGAVAFPPNDDSAPEVLFNCCMIIFTFLGNVMIVNFYIAYLTNHYEKLKKQALFALLKNQYKYFKLYPQNELDYYYFIPLNLDIIVTPIAFYFHRHGSIKRLEKWVKGLSHFLQIVIPGLLLVSLASIFVILVHFIITWIKMFKNLWKKPTKFALLAVFWLILGFPFLFLLALVDIYNFLNVITDYNTNYQEISNPEIKQKSRYDIQIFFSEFRKRVAVVRSAGKKCQNSEFLNVRIINEELTKVIKAKSEVKDVRIWKLISLREKYFEFAKIARQYSLNNKKEIELLKAEGHIKIMGEEDYWQGLDSFDLEALEDAFEATNKVFLSDFQQNLERIKDKLLKLKSIMPLKL